MLHRPLWAAEGATPPSDYKNADVNQQALQYHQESPGALLSRTAGVINRRWTTLKDDLVVGVGPVCASHKARVGKHCPLVATLSLIKDSDATAFILIL